mmetsp:Transcript_247/g.595  ORF Transcript_247/g.595 Transcript_247/m.595 type:complete len:323 (+) Transcript_247:136-1104(+)
MYLTHLLFSLCCNTFKISYHHFNSARYYSEGTYTLWSVLKAHAVPRSLAARSSAARIVLELRGRFSPPLAKGVVLVGLLVAAGIAIAVVTFLLARNERRDTLGGTNARNRPSCGIPLRIPPSRRLVFGCGSFEQQGARKVPSAVINGDRNFLTNLASLLFCVALHLNPGRELLVPFQESSSTTLLDFDDELIAKDLVLVVVGSVGLDVVVYRRPGVTASTVPVKSLAFFLSFEMLHHEISKNRIAGIVPGWCSLPKDNVVETRTFHDDHILIEAVVAFVIFRQKWCSQYCCSSLVQFSFQNLSDFDPLTVVARLDVSGIRNR